MKKSIAILACLATAPLNFAHAGDRFNQHEANRSDSASNFTPDSTDGSKSLSMLVPDEDPRFKVADQDVQERPMVTNDPTEFQRLLPQSQSLVHVDFSTVAGQSAPFFVGTIKEEGVAIKGEPGQTKTARAVTSYEGLPATYWFGPQAESTFVLANGAVQIVFPQDVDAVSLLTTTADKEKLLPEQKVSGQAGAGQTILIDANGLMVGQGSITIKSGSALLGILSDIPFRSVIISSTAETWMFLNLNYVADNIVDEAKYVVDEHDNVAGEKQRVSAKADN